MNAPPGAKIALVYSAAAPALKLGACPTIWLLLPRLAGRAHAYVAAFGSCFMHSGAEMSVLCELLLESDAVREKIGPVVDGGPEVKALTGGNGILRSRVPDADWTPSSRSTRRH